MEMTTRANTRGTHRRTLHARTDKDVYEFETRSRFANS